MPVYEYECPTCVKVIEVQQRMSDAPLTTCPDCAGQVKKIVSMSSFHLKGGGWYSDGYGSKAPADSEKTEKVSDKKSKPDTKTPSVTPCKGAESKSCKKCSAAT